MTALGAMRGATEADLEAVAREVAFRLSDQMDPLVARVVETVLGHVPELLPLDADEPWASSAASVRSNIESVLGFMPAGAGVESVQPPPVTRARVRRLVRENMDVELILRAYRWGHAELWAAWQEEVCAVDLGAAARTRLLDDTSRVLFAYVDRVSAVIAEDYAREQRAWSRSPAALRAEVVRGLLAGTCEDPHVASSRLGYELGARHVAFVVWSEGHEAAESALERAAEAVGRCLGARSRLTVPLSGSVLIGWCGSAVGFAEDAFASVRSLVFEPGVRVGLGDRARGVEGFVRSHREALATRELMRRHPGGRACRRYGDVALASLLIADRERAEDYTAAVLGPLAEEADQPRRLRATLSVLLEEGGSHTKTASRLNVHKNTVGNRVARIEELLGRPIDRRCHDLEAALLISQTLRESDGADEGGEAVDALLVAASRR